MVYGMLRLMENLYIYMCAGNLENEPANIAFNDEGTKQQ